MQYGQGENPIACARCYSCCAEYPGEDKAVAILVDDIADNDGNSESTCWLYDCDYSYLADPSIGQIVFGGPRCRDQYLRALLAGVSPEEMRQYHGEFRRDGQAAGYGPVQNGFCAP